jgi:hypothetical protein
MSQMTTAGNAHTGRTPACVSESIPEIAQTWREKGRGPHDEIAGISATDAIVDRPSVPIARRNEGIGLDLSNA